METKLRVLFLCTHNSARSQLAEGILRDRAEDEFEVLSAGSEKTTVRPEAISVMDEIGIDISGQFSKTFDGFLREKFDWVITVCDDAAEACPAFPGPAKRLHWSIADPNDVKESDEKRLQAFRDARDQLMALIDRFLVENRK